MSTGPGPIVTRRVLRAELRRMRTELKLSIEHVAREMEWSPSKLVRIEGGQVGIQKADLGALLTLYGVTDNEVVEELEELARGSRQRMWWSQYQKHLPQTMIDFIGAEFAASTIFYIQGLIIPSLLQTREYATAMNAATSFGSVHPETATARVDVRLRRQREILARDSGRKIHTIIDEATLRHLVGGIEVMGPQLDHIAKMATSTALDVVVLPFSHGAHVGMIGPFTLMQYDDPQVGEVVYLESATGGLIVRDDPTTVARYRESADRLVTSGISGKAAADFVRTVRKEIG
jgi:transcriptional regulator with XRE-family HTH domain